MAFFKFRQSGQTPPEARARAEEAAASSPTDTIERLRRRARHRLLGAAVLVLVAVIGFPLIFDTQPRPIAVDAPIIIPDRDKVAPLKVPTAPSAGVSAAASLADKEEVVTSAPAGAPAARPAVVKPPVVAMAPVPAAPAPSKAAAAHDSEGDDKPAPKKAEPRPASTREASREAPAKPVAKPTDSSAEATKPPADEPREPANEARARREEQAARAKREAEARTKREEAARARALLEGRGTAAAAKEDAKPAPAAASRFIVQVGAFADADKVRQVRQQAERAGVKTYTQVVQTADGPRTRVRVGPYASREEAEKAAGALKKAGLAGAILTP